MKATGDGVVELIRMGEWSILELRGSIPSDREGSGISHLECESWKRYGMHPYDLYCDKCKAEMPEDIITVWILLNADKLVGRQYLALENGL
jgi:hypothetical protein